VRTPRRSPVPFLAALALAAPMLASCGAGPDAAVAQPESSVRAAASGLAPRGEVVGGLVVDRVVDGDTVKLELDGDYVSVRLIGMNTPETVKPDSPVECFGPESSQFAKATLTGARVTLEFDESQGRTDRYDRTLAYVWRELPDGSLSLFNLELIAGGYAVERQYGSTPYAWRDEFVRAQRLARDAGAGLWGACPDS
jgi:micrococcal nuclease